jgi:hypothetical protein
MQLQSLHQLFVATQTAMDCERAWDDRASAQAYLLESERYPELLRETSGNDVEADENRPGLGPIVTSGESAGH